MLRLCLLLALLMMVPGTASAVSKFYLHDAASSVSGYKDADLSPGLSLKTSVTATVASGTDIQVTATNGGSVIKWLTKPLASGITISGSATCNLWGLESNTAANASLRCRYFKYSGGSEGSQIYIAQAPGELTASITLKSIVATPTSTAFSAGDRIAIYVYLENCSATSGCPTGTMSGSGRTVTVDYDAGTAAADGDSWLQITETVGVQQTLAIASTFAVHDAVSVAKTTAWARALPETFGQHDAVSMVRGAAVPLPETFGQHCAVCFDQTSPLDVTFGMHDTVSIDKTSGGGTGWSRSIAETFAQHCSVCFDQSSPLDVTFGMHDTVNIAKTSPGIALPQTFAMSPAIECCVTTPLLDTTFGMTPSLAMTKTEVRALPETLGLSPAVLMAKTHSIPLGMTFGMHDAVSVQRGVTLALNETLGITPTPLVIPGHFASITLSTTLGLSPTVTFANTLNKSLPETFAMSPAVAVLHDAPRAFPVTLGLSPAVNVSLTLVKPLAETLGMHITVSVVKNAVNSRGMVVTT